MPFTSWGESFILALIFFVMIATPCSLVGWIGKRFIDQLGRWPSRAPSIHMSVCWSLIAIEIMTFMVFFIFIQLFRV